MSNSDNLEGHVDDVRLIAQKNYRSHLELLSSGHVDEWVDLFAEDAIYELPYALDGEPSRLTGKAELKNYMGNFPKDFRLKFVDLRFHETADPSLLVVEARGQHVHIASGRPYNQTYINVVETRNGTFTHFKDFMNPLVVMKALGLDRQDGEGGRRVDANVKLVEKFIAALDVSDTAALSEMIHDDFYFEMPYAPDLLPRLHPGREQAIDFFGSMAAWWDRANFVDLKVNVINGDEGLLVATYRSETSYIATGNEYENSYVSFFAVVNGKLSYMKEHFDPIAPIVALGGSINPPAMPG